MTPELEQEISKNVGTATLDTGQSISWLTVFVANMPRGAKKAVGSWTVSVVIGSFLILLNGCTFAGDESKSPISGTATGIEAIPDSGTIADADAGGITAVYPDSALLGGVFRLAAGNGIVADPVIVDDPIGNYLNSHWVISEIYSGLTKIDEESTPPVQLDLAEKYTISESGRVYEFTLRPGLKFSDGSPVTAHDIKWSWERALNPRTRSVRATSVLGPIEGGSAILDGDATELSGVVAVDERVLKVTLADFRGDFLALLADPVAVVLKQENVENWGIDWGSAVHESAPANMGEHDELPIGTGPFKLESFDYLSWPLDIESQRTLSRTPSFS